MSVETERGGGESPSFGMSAAVRGRLLTFQFTNAINFSIALGAPMVLLARFLHAGESIIGFLVALTPYMAILQIVGAPIGERLGYRRLMIAGWRARSAVLLLLCPLPFLPGLWPGWLIITVLCCAMAAFSLLRGIASSAWMPWVATLVPVGYRGRYIGLEHQTIHLSVLITMLLSGAFLGESPAGWKYTLLFGGATLAGFLSVIPLLRLPESRPVERPSGEPRQWIPWRRAMALQRHRPFRRYNRFSALNDIFATTMPGFLILFLKESLYMSEKQLLYMASAATVGAFLVAAFAGRLCDRYGSKPFMRIAGSMRLLTLVFWLLVALGVFSPAIALVAVVQCVTGMTYSLHAVPAARLLLGACPPHEAAVGLAFNQVIVSLAGGTAPLLFGFVVEALRGRTVVDPFAWVFGSILFTVSIAQVLLSRIPEPEASSASRLLVKLVSEWPSRVLTAFTGEEETRR